MFSFTVVTGCTDGIGRQYALELAKHGLNIVLVSRTESKLVELSNEIGKSLSFYFYKALNDLKFYHSRVNLQG